MKTQFNDVIGLIPAAGLATRLGPLTCSKEILPVGFKPSEDGRSSCPKVACEYLLEHLKCAGITKVFLILREGKWDIPTCLGDGRALGINLGYLLMGLPYGPPFTLDQAYPFARDALVATGFPDIIFESDDAFARLMGLQKETHADVVLGLFPADQPANVDMIEMDNEARVRQIIIKPSRTALTHTWGIALWTPVFTQFMHDHLGLIQGRFEGGNDNPRELHVGDVIQAAIDEGLHVKATTVSDKPYIDIGVPENLQKMRAKTKVNKQEGT